MRVLSRVVAASPKSGWALFERGKARIEARDWEGLDDLEQALALHPRDVPLADMPRSEEIRRLFERLNEAVEAGQRPAQALAWRGWAQRLLGRHDAALADVRRALELGFPEETGLCWRADLLIRLGRLDAALETLERAVQLRPSATALALRGECLLRLGRVEPAVKALEEAAAADPKSAQAHLWLGTAHLAAGRREEAREALERAAALDPSEPRAHARLAQAWRSLGDVSRSDAALRDAAQACPVSADSAAEWLWKPDPAVRTALLRLSLKRSKGGPR